MATITINDIPQSGILTTLLESKGMIPKDGNGFVSIGESFFNDFAGYVMESFPGQDALVESILSPFDFIMEMVEMLKDSLKDSQGDGFKFNSENIYSIKMLEGKIDRIYGPAIMANYENGSATASNLVLQIGINRFKVDYVVEPPNPETGDPAKHKIPLLKGVLKTKVSNMSAGDGYCSMFFVVNVSGSRSIIPVIPHPSIESNAGLEERLESGDLSLLSGIVRPALTGGSFLKLRDTNAGDVYTLHGTSAVKSGTYGLELVLADGRAVTTNTALNGTIENIITAISQTATHPDHADPLAGAAKAFAGGSLVIKGKIERTSKRDGSTRTQVDASLFTKQFVESHPEVLTPKVTTPAPDTTPKVTTPDPFDDIPF